MQFIALLAFGSVWLMLRERDVIARVGIPIGLSITGTAIVVNNVVVIAALA